VRARRPARCKASARRPLPRARRIRPGALARATVRACLDSHALRVPTGSQPLGCCSLVSGSQTGVTLEPGLHGERAFDVDDGLVTDVGGTLAAQVLSTPGMIAMMERTAAMLVYPYLSEGRATVGFEVCVKHVDSAARGSRCTARATLREVADGRKLFFDVEVVGGDRVIGVGTHQRRIVDTSGG
jgi:fluoroacetyl-CoA thioesterase